MTTKTTKQLTLTADQMEAIAEMVVQKLKQPQQQKQPQQKQSIRCKIPGKPSTLYVERDWVWVGWKNKPSEKVLDKLHADGWHYSHKRKQWHHENV